MFGDRIGGSQMSALHTRPHLHAYTHFWSESTEKIKMKKKNNDKKTRWNCRCTLVTNTHTHRAQLQTFSILRGLCARPFFISRFAKPKIIQISIFGHNLITSTHDEDVGPDHHGDDGVSPAINSIWRAQTFYVIKCNQIHWVKCQPNILPKPPIEICM